MIFEILRTYQIYIMIGLAGACAVLALMAGITKSVSHTRKIILVSMELGAMLLLLSDVDAYVFRGDTSTVGYYMVRISNFMVFFMSLHLIHTLNNFFIDLYRNEQRLERIPRRLYAAEIIYVIGIILLVISQFTGLYYTFDEMNQYQRAPGFIICYAMPLIMLFLQLSVLVKYHDKISRSLYTALLLFTVLPLVASVIQVFTYGVSLTNMTCVGLVILLFVVTLKDMDEQIRQANDLKIEMMQKAQDELQKVFEQTAEALANAIDAKDQYTHGHSTRVARYSERIAAAAGKSEEERNDIYFTALLHDVGKIGVPDKIINKDGKLTDEEFAWIKRHPVIGNQILSSISSSPYLSIGAHYHHERYDGRGYPDGLIGEDIPEIARIIAVADSYDAMTSKRSYRDPLPQQEVREQLLEGTGTQFDPRFADIMLHMIDEDTSYEMKENLYEGDDNTISELRCENVIRDCSIGIHIDNKQTSIRLRSTAIDGSKDSMPSLILFDALDGRVHDTEAEIRNLLYNEYGLLSFDGTVTSEDLRADRTVYNLEKARQANARTGKNTGTWYEISAVRYHDHARVRIAGPETTSDTIIALPDSSRFLYIALSGTNCVLDEIQIRRSEIAIGEGDIPRIAEEVSYTAGMPEGDIPNIEVYGFREVSTGGIAIGSGLRLSFHTRSLPTARLVWHCPYISLFTSDDGLVGGEGFREFVLVRLDGEKWESDEHVINEINVDRSKGFEGWEAWKKTNKEGMDVEVSIERTGNKVMIATSNQGISILSTSVINDGTDDLYIALTGDQVAITDIHINHG
ncbi:MAG: HD domain-containing protein [Mogibacterium sp.]|nr:HD domain-containing protein [Mogibacterium sp.]